MRIMKCESIMDRDGSLRLEDVRFPKLASFKFDGNRCYVENGEAKSSSGKPIRNEYIRSVLSDALLTGLDGEIIVGSPTAVDVRRVTTSGVSSIQGEPDFKFYVFDNFLRDMPFELRLHFVNRVAHPSVEVVRHTMLHSISELELFEREALSLGYEGVILRCPYAPYKEGRSTLKQNWALKIKRFIDAEAKVVGFYERQHNDNAAILNDHGYTQRSSHAENKRGAGDLGGLTVVDIKSGVKFNVGTGFDAQMRFDLWHVRDALIGKILTYKKFPVGEKDKPNLPSFIAFRDLDDMA